MRRILLAVNDSPAGLAAARAALDMAKQCGGQVLAVHVVPGPPPPTSGPGSSAGDAGPEETGARPSPSVLAYIALLAERSSVSIETRALPGVPAQVIIEQAVQWQPDVIVLGRSGVRHVGQPFVGSQVLHVIEFADLPVLVVPAV